MRPQSTLHNFSVTFVALAMLSLCGLAVAINDPASLRDLRRVRREITDALQPSIAVVGKDKNIATTGILQEEMSEFARAGTGMGDAQQDPPPGGDGPLISVFAQELSDKYESADFIAADVGQETGTVQDATTFLGTVEVEPGTTPPGTMAGGPEITSVAV